LPTRFAAFLIAVLFLLNGAESAFGMHKCPHHDLVAADASGHSMHQMAGHLMAGHEMGGHSDPGESGHSAPCTCQGACQMSSTAALPQPVVAAPGAAIVLVEVPVARAEDLLARRLSPFFLPSSQAPPRVG
jgi:hypothetical protein